VPSKTLCVCLGFSKDDLEQNSLMNTTMPVEQEIPNCQPQDMRKWVKRKEGEFG